MPYPPVPPRAGWTSWTCPRPRQMRVFSHKPSFLLSLLLCTTSLPWLSSVRLLSLSWLPWLLSLSLTSQTFLHWKGSNFWINPKANYSFFEGPVQTSYCTAPQMGLRLQSDFLMSLRTLQMAYSAPFCCWGSLAQQAAHWGYGGVGGGDGIRTNLKPDLLQAGPVGNAALLCRLPYQYLSPDSPCSRIIRGSTGSLTWQFSSKKQSPIPNSGEEKDSSDHWKYLWRGEEWPSFQVPPPQEPPSLLRPPLIARTDGKGELWWWRLFLSNKTSLEALGRCLVQRVWSFYRCLVQFPKIRRSLMRKKSILLYKCLGVNT